ncbi:hypothetical protein EDB85DRAFT_1238285 [Lactarius pseudohatsudake]|nr:hypothetical protein EDB85DRAFT_1238285 [Lactarius pseudohatsudake]
MQKCDCPARRRNTSRAVWRLIGGMHSGQHGSWTTFAHTRKCISPVIPDTVPCATAKTKMRFPFALPSPKLANALVALTWQLLPIGAYEPRAIVSNEHVSPADAVRIFKDLKAKKALAMHWGNLGPGYRTRPRASHASEERV